MHQHPRHPPRGASPASSPQTNPTRTNNQRDVQIYRVRSPGNSSRDGGSSTGSGEIAPLGSDEQKAKDQREREKKREQNIKKLDQIVQVG